MKCNLIKTIINSAAVKSQRGYALILVLIVLFVGSLIIAPLLSFMGTGIISGMVHERRTDELYSADAGIEDAFHEILTVSVDLPVVGEQLSYTLPEPVNGKQVDVLLEHIAEPTYKITATATTDANSSTSIESVASILYFQLIMDNAITSPGNINIQPGGYVAGDVQYNGELDNDGEITGDIITDDIESWEWPTADQVRDFYFGYVEGLAPYADGTIDLKDVASLPSLYRAGDLNIKNTGPTTTVSMDGVIYVTGDLTFQQPGGTKAYTIDLAGHTIFVEGNIVFPPQFVSIAGPGAIIAIGDINFQPGIENADEYIFLLSVDGWVDFSPQDSFYGSVAGDVDVNLQPNVSLYNEEDPPDGLLLPGEDDSINIISGIHTWDIQVEMN
jgi:hypothetical protein